VYYRRAACCAFFLWSKGLNTKDIHKEVFPVYGGKCLSRKAVHNWVRKFKDVRKSQMMPEQVRKWLRQQSEDFYAAGLDTLVRVGTSVSMLVEDMSRNNFFFPGSNITCFTFYIHL
jgi:uncharacterized protein (UPF0147 family)